MLFLAVDVIIIEDVIPTCLEKCLVLERGKTLHSPTGAARKSLV